MKIAKPDIADVERLQGNFPECDDLFELDDSELHQVSGGDVGSGVIHFPK